MHTWYEQAVFYHIYPLGLLGAEKTNTLTETAHRFVALEDWIPHIHALNGSAIYIGPLFESSTQIRHERRPPRGPASGLQ